MTMDFKKDINRKIDGIIKKSDIIFKEIDLKNRTPQEYNKGVSMSSRMDLFKRMLSQIKQQDTTKSSDTERLIEYGDDCDHSRKEEIYGSVFCVDCGIEFENEINYQWYIESTDSSSDDERSGEPSGKPSEDLEHHIMRETKKSTSPPPPPSPTST